MKKFISKLDPAENPKKVLETNKGNLEVLKNGLDAMIDVVAEDT
jgi:hypothetical protein